MDAYEATQIVFQRVQTLDPQSANKIMGFLLIQDNGEKEMIRLAFGPESLLHSVILKTKKDLSLCSSPNTPPTPSSPFAGGGNSSGGGSNGNPFSLSRQNSSSRIPSPLSILNANSHSFSSSWTNSRSSFSDELVSPGAAYGNGGEVDLIDELHLQDQLSFLNDGSPLPSSSPTGNEPQLFADPWAGSALLQHRRSFSDDPADGWKPCLFYDRGYCKNGTACRFLHGETAADAAAPAVGSPSKFEMLEQLNSNFLYSPSSGANKGINFPQFPLDSPRGSATTNLIHKFDRRSDFGVHCFNPGARQIYLTFPADSAFKEEDVSNYFSNFGPVQDVRIPYQQKRMFGFVTFDFPETVKLILAKGNPHFVCDARVLVKPYKEKGKIPDKHKKQQMERGDFIGSPTGLESRDPYDFQLGATRMFYNNTSDMLQQAIELQNRRLMGLQLLDVKRNNNNINYHRSLSTGGVISSPTAFSPTYFGQNGIGTSNQRSPDAKEENGLIGSMVKETQQQPAGYGFEKEDSMKESGLCESSEHNLPDSPFASPKASKGYSTAFSNGISEVEKGISIASTSNNLITGPSFFPANPSLDVSPFKSCYFQVPRFASGHETIGT